MKKFSKTLGVCLLLAFTLNACYYRNFDCIKGNGAVVQEEKTFAATIHSVHSSIPGNVYITQGDEQKVEVKAQQNIIDLLNIQVVNGELRLETNGKCIRNGLIEVFVTTAQIKRISLAGAGQIIGQNLWTSPELDIDVSGAGKVSTEIKSTTLSTHLSGAGEVKLSGHSQTQSIRISGAGNYKALGLTSEKAIVNVSGAGNCELQVSQSLGVEISGSGQVKYQGNPSVTQRISGAGSLKKIN